MQLPRWLPSLALCASCATVTSSADLTGPPAPPSTAPGAVRVAFTRDPSGAEELGIVEAHGRRPGATLDALVEELRSRVATVGGDVARVDAFATTYENVTEAYTYDCGTTRTTSEPRTVSRSGPDGRMTTQTEMTTVTKHEPKTCTGYRQVEVAVLTLTGRAFRTKGPNP